MREVRSEERLKSGVALVGGSGASAELARSGVKCT